MALHARSWLDVATVTPRIALDLRLALRDDAGSWTPTDEEVLQIESALSRAYDRLRGYAEDEGVTADELDSWDVREDYQYELMKCLLGKTRFMQQDPNRSDWVQSGCDEVEAYFASDPTLKDVNGDPLATTETDAIARRSPRYTNGNGLLGANHTRLHDVNAASVTRSGKLVAYTATTGTGREIT